MLTSKVCLESLRDSLESHYDLFLCSSSYEARCLSIPHAIKGLKTEHIIVVQHSPTSLELKANTQALNSILNNEHELAIGNLGNPLELVDNLSMLLERLNPRSDRFRILMDITTFTHESLLTTLKVLNILVPNCMITYVYNSAASYSVTQPKECKWLSRGVREIRAVLGFPGFMSPRRNLHLIVIVGYEVDRAAKLIEYLEPAKVTLCYGKQDSATTDSDREANEYYHHLLKKIAITYCPNDIFSEEISCDDPRQVQELLERLIEKHANSNIAIAPMNNKLTTIAVYETIQHNKHVQVCYSQPIVYNQRNYSNPSKSCYVVTNDDN